MSLMTKTKNTTINLAGVDLSLTSPAVCIFKGERFSIEDCSFYFLTDKKKNEISTPMIHGHLFENYLTEQERYDNISRWIMHLVQKHDIHHVFIEDYSFGSTGRVFNIAENCGLLKYKLWHSKIPFTTIPPTVIKKNATGKGNANKEKLQEQFYADTGIDVKKILNMTDKQWNPSSDIIDSYFICECGYENYREAIRSLHSGD